MMEFKKHWCFPNHKRKNMGIKETNLIKCKLWWNVIKDKLKFQMFICTHDIEDEMHSGGSEHSQCLSHVRPGLEWVLEDETDALHHALDEHVAEQPRHRRDDCNAVARIHPLFGPHRSIWRKKRYSSLFFKYKSYFRKAEFGSE